MWEKKIDEIREKLMMSIESLSDHEINTKPSEQEWSISEIILHLIGAEGRFMKLANQAAEEGNSRSVGLVNLSPLDNRKQKHIAPIDPPSDFHTKEQLVCELIKCRRQTHIFLNHYIEKDLANHSMNHHRFGEMPIWQVFELMGKHELRHLHQIEEVKQRIL
ncbi:hypothetical protein JOC86_003096 [Bacillus pakistanensis]|uniref:DinB-like domain-containing protein n=1 Tax=Rossellomorea pakistanensis TaxID=992288 RepID=A0ABS2NFB7_9BACI|nr:DinB family protein [Bacillus pakistanensis]MBM7586544.1 hypothetical protein [Bacillus pakistanensis]